MAFSRVHPAAVLLWIYYLSSWVQLSISTDPSILVSVDQIGIWVYHGDSISMRDSSAVNISKKILSNVKIRSMDVNTADGSVYFFDITSRCIYRLHSSKVEKVHCGVSSSVFSSIAYDWVSGNMYWTDGFFNWIAVQPVSTTDKSMYRVIIQDDIENPRALTIDSKAGYMFWFDISPSGYRIERSLLDGTVRIPIITTSLLNVHDIEIDAAERRLYWTEVGRDTIESSQYDGTDRKIIYRELHINFRSIAVDKCPTLGCEHFCVNVQPNGKCMCKEGYTLDTDGKHCTEIHSLYHKGILVSNATNICMLSARTVTDHGDPLLCVGNAVQGCKHLTVDAGNKLIYYHDTISKYIREYNLVTNTIRQITPVDTVSGIAFDWTDGNLYWSESTSGKLKYITIATTKATELLQVTSPPSHLTIDPHTRTLFWVMGTSGYAMSIVSMSLVSKATSTVLNQPSPAFIKDIFFDVISDKLFFVESDKLYSTTRNGSGTHNYYNNLQSVDKLIIYKRYAIWSETISSKVYTISLQQKDLETTNLTINLGMITGLAVYDDALQRPSNGPCFYMNGGCEQLCMTGISGSAVCACSYGLTLQSDGKSCSSVPQSSNFLLVPDFSHSKLFQISITDAQITALDIDIVDNPIHAVYDPKTSFVFWTDLNDKSIMKSTLSGRNVDIVFTSKGVDSYPTALALDNSTGNLYYTVTGKEDTISPGSVGVLKPSSGVVRTLVDNLNIVYGLALYPSKGLLFYTHQDDNNTFLNIVRVSMDGTLPSVITTLDAGDFLTSLTIDYTTERLYWSSLKGGVGSSSLSGTSRVKFATSFKDIRSVVAVGGSLYLTSIERHKVVKMDLHAKTEVPFMIDNAELGYMFNLFAYPGQEDPERSVCSSNNGGCSDFCLPKASVSQSYCACQEGTDLKPDDPYTCVGAIRCPLAISNGKFDDLCTRNVGDACTFQCNVGYISTVPSKTVTCGQDGQWNGNLQQLCQTIRCPLAISNGKFDDLCTRNVGDACMFQCNVGYITTVPSNTVTCGQDGQWNGNLQQLCQPIRCPLAISNGKFDDLCTRNVGDACMFQCNVGYISTVPSKTVTCGQDGQWNGNLQQLCQPIRCPLDISNGKFDDLCTRNVGDTCMFQCNVGYISAVPSKTVTCGQDGQWNGNLQQLCQLKTSLPSPDENKTYIYVGAGLAGLVIISVTIVVIACSRKRRRGPENSPARSEPNVYYTPYQGGHNQGGMLATGVVNQGMYNTGSQFDEKLKNLPSADIPTPPYQLRPETTYDTIPAYSEPAPPYEEPRVNRHPPESPVVTVPGGGQNDYLTLLPRS